MEPEPIRASGIRATVETAINAYMADAKDRGNSEATLYKKRHTQCEPRLRE